MSTVTLNNGRTFSVDASVSILDAARNAGVVLEYSCRSGRCGICKVPVIAGSTILLRPEESLSTNETAEGVILTCCRAAKTDLVLDVEPLDRLANLTIKTIPARIVSLDRLAKDILKVVLRTPPTSPMHFLAGQYVDMIAAGTRRSYSFANSPRADGMIELVIKRYNDGVMSSYLFDCAQVNDLVRLEGPFGTFFLREDAPADIVFLATGTGIAPVKAILEEIAANPSYITGRRLTVFWGNREAENFCWDPAGLGLDINFTHLLSGSDDGWVGDRGYVQEAAIRHGLDLDETVVYACGSNAMIASARTLMLTHGLPAKRFFSDAFVSSN